MFVVVVGEIALSFGLAHAGEAVGGGELGHDEAAAGLLIGLLGFDGVCGFGFDVDPVEKTEAFLIKRRKTVSVTPGHGGEDGGRGDADGADVEFGGDAGRAGMG